MKKRTSRHAILVLAFLMLGVIASACGSTGNSGSSKGLNGTITYWAYQSSPDGQTALQQLKQKFETEHPGAHVTIVPIPKDDFNTKLSTALATGTSPDASVIANNSVETYAQKGQIVPAPQGLVNESDFYPVPLNTNKYNGQLYGLPQGQTSIALFYNKDLLPTPPTTWDEFVADAQKTYNPSKKIAAVYFPTGGGYAGWMFPAFAAQQGGTMLDETNKQIGINSPASVKALTLWKQLYSYSPSNITGAQYAFQTGHVAMMISGPWEIPGFAPFPNLHWGVTMLPKGTQYATNLGGEDGIVYKKSQHQDLAWAWLKFLSTEGNVTLNDKVTNNFPIYLNEGGVDSAWAKEVPARQLFLQEMTYAHADPSNPNWPKINDEVLGTAIENALLKNQDPQAALDAAASQAKGILGW